MKETGLELGAAGYPTSVCGLAGQALGARWALSWPGSLTMTGTIEYSAPEVGTLWALTIEGPS